ncbi:MAG: undecaprenyldiphospho-muramoylpentapeptide beta-N-acetylglucosaminyltransferase [Elusimicrobiota bacterium]|jgi:UDP-N-acetylglucosamine--N-acetylmuramyl-(pentapeptide) pyrophosphoryl-undecaprenol N-acetylglucosamine transferase
MRIVIACGGTGGHFYPGYALGRRLRERGHEVLFVLRSDDPAAARLEADDLPYAELDLRGLPRKVSTELLAFPWRLGRSVLAARALIRAWRPSAAVGMGGYLTFPLGAAARSCGIPVVLHESNAVLGLAVRAILPFADALALGLPLCDPGAAPGATLTGTPVRSGFSKLPDSTEARRRLSLEPERATLLVFGGSQGARAVNRAAPAALARLRAEGVRPQVLHLAGRAEAEETSRLYREAGLPEARVLPYLEDMPAAYAAADVVLCRAGAATLAELAAARRAAVLVPYPSAAAGHQERNARVLETAGAARMLKEPFPPEALADRLRELFSDAALRARMADAYARIGLPSAKESASALADLVEKVVRAHPRRNA